MKYLDKILGLVGLTMIVVDLLFLPYGYIWVEALGVLLIGAGTVIGLRRQKDDSYMQYGLAAFLVMYLFLLVGVFIS